MLTLPAGWSYRVQGIFEWLWPLACSPVYESQQEFNIAR